MNISLEKYNQDDFDRGRSNLIIILWWIVQGTIFRFSFHNMYNWRNLLLRIFGAKIGKGVKIRSSAKFTYPWKVSIGDHSWVGDDVICYSLDKIEIEDNCVISQKSYLCTGSHSTHLSTFDLVTAPIRIKHGAWIAADVFIYPGVIIENLTVISARSTLTKTTLENSIYSGSPAVFLRQRFEREDSN